MPGSTYDELEKVARRLAEERAGEEKSEHQRRDALKQGNAHAYPALESSHKEEATRQRKDALRVEKARDAAPKLEPAAKAVTEPQLGTRAEGHKAPLQLETALKDVLPAPPLRGRYRYPAPAPGDSRFGPTRLEQVPQRPADRAGGAGQTVAPARETTDAQARRATKEVAAETTDRKAARTDRHFRIELTDKAKAALEKASATERDDRDKGR